jgi:hypothetical protein
MIGKPSDVTKTEMESDEDEEQLAKPKAQPESKPAAQTKVEPTNTNVAKTEPVIKQVATEKVQVQQVKPEIKTVQETIDTTQQKQEQVKYEEPPMYEAPSQEVVDDAPIESELAPKQEEIEIDDYFQPETVEMRVGEHVQTTEAVNGLELGSLDGKFVIVERCKLSLQQIDCLNCSSSVCKI